MKQTRSHSVMTHGQIKKIDESSPRIQAHSQVKKNG